MIEGFDQCNSMLCWEDEAEMPKVEFQESGPALKKAKKTILAAENVDSYEVAESQDRLGDLPDCLIHHILSFMETKDAIRTCVLSKRWRYIWASVPCLNFSSKSFNRLVDFKKFVLWVLSHRDDSQVKVLIYYRFGVDYATDHFTLCYTGIDCLNPFATCVNLKNLHLGEMSFKSDLNPKDFVISAPKLKNLSLMCNRFKCKIVVAAPTLTNFSYLYSTSCAFFEFSLPSLDGLVIDIHEPRDQLEKSIRRKREETLHGLINMIRGHCKSEAVKLSFCTVAVSCGTAVFLKPEFYSCSKLKSLNFGVGSTYKIFISNLDNITAYFRDCSQHADFEILTI
ncbi:hypothetical protein Ahy_A09g046134 isoform B [Arachis hypogaea]|uniref:F-box domain-containing protein n=1 Tax=Arachis hypogaea TaxID=3818 RepID=A0A445BNX3_ARAHY|nr:hypothetical protein Ahy_A09g046134 isoform A [Arachis hypogaea]RYR40380.1 hypothetical protein Ahy_A09g046134 isoform B [Arachis hypogaea]